MDLLDRYLQAVRKHLPWKRQDDILAELRANLESQLEEHEAALGRPLTQAEAEAWLMEIGPPMQVAARYQPQQFLIGPTIFPIYWYVLRTAMVWGFAILAIVAAVQIMAKGFDSGSAFGSATPGLYGPNTGGVETLQAVIEALFNIPFSLLQIALWVTLTFAAFEFAIARGAITLPPMDKLDKLTRDWPPSKLPPLERASASGMKARTRSQAIAEVVLGVMLLIWLPLIPKYPVVILGPGADQLGLARFAFAHACYWFYLGIMALNLLQVTWNVIDLARGSWQRPRPGKHLIFKIVGLIPLLFLITAPDHVLLILKDRATDAARFGVAVDAINHWSHVGLTIAFVMSVCQLLWDAIQWGLGIYRQRVAIAS